MRFNDAVIGAAFIILAAAMIAMTFSFPAFPGQKYGPNLFPRIIGVGIAGTGVLLILRGLRERAAGGRWLTLDSWTGEPRRVASFVVMLLAMGFYLVASEPLGFIPTALVLQFGLFLWFGVRPVTAAIVAVVMTLIVHWFFSVMMRVPLPRGILDNVL